MASIRRLIVQEGIKQGVLTKVEARKLLDDCPVNLDIGVDEVLRYRKDVKPAIEKLKSLQLGVKKVDVPKEEPIFKPKRSKRTKKDKL